MKKPFFIGKEITELEATIGTIKLWSYLALNGEHEKEQYFADTPVEDIPLAGCHYCEYYLYQNRHYPQNRNYPDAEMKDTCKRTGCPLATDKLCNFSEKGSAFEIWKGFRKDIWAGNKASAGIRVQCAKQILKAAKKHYKKLTGEVYHEK